MATTTILAPSISSNRGKFSLARAWALACTMWQARQTRRLLAEMDPRLLADIGASPSDAHREANRPFWDVTAR